MAQLNGLTYGTYLQQIATMAVIPQNDTNLMNIAPLMIAYAENRLQRDLDFLSTQTSTTSYPFTQNVNTLTIPTYQFIVPQTFEVVNLSGVSSPLLPISKEFIQNVYGSGSTTGLPQYFAVYGGDSATTGNTSQYIIVGPTPDQAYNTILTGTVRSAPLGYLPTISSATASGTTGTIIFSGNHNLSTGATVYLGGFNPIGWNGSFTCTVNSSTTISITLPAGTASATFVGYAANGSNTTFISTYLPDIFIMASLIYISAFQRNFGRINDDPQMAQTYESQYQALKASALVEENRKKFQASAWSSYSPAPAASPTRG